jgi:hypothetical protein
MFDALDNSCAFWLKFSHWCNFQFALSFCVSDLHWVARWTEEIVLKWTCGERDTAAVSEQRREICMEMRGNVKGEAGVQGI